MKIALLIKGLNWKINIILFIFLSFTLKAQQEPFYCDYNAYLFQYNDVYAIDLASGSSYLVATDICDGIINGAGYNPADGYIWGYQNNVGTKSIIKIGKNFNVSTYEIAEIPDTTTNGKYIGDISVSGIYHFKGSGTTFYKINLDPASANYIEYEGAYTLSQDIRIHDWAFNAVDGMFYTVEKQTNHLYRINGAQGMLMI